MLFYSATHTQFKSWEIETRKFFDFKRVEVRDCEHFDICEFSLRDERDLLMTAHSSGQIRYFKIWVQYIVIKIY
jgi:hypothetical protein